MMATNIGGVALTPVFHGPHTQGLVSGLAECEFHGPKESEPLKEPSHPVIHPLP